MKILLINPPYTGNINTWTPDSTNQAIGVQPPLGLAYLAAVLRSRGYAVQILDINALNLTREEVVRKVREINPDVAGITVMTLLAQNAVKVARLIKDVNSNIKVVLGGPHLSIFSKETLSFDCVDYGIYGEGEYALLDLLRKIEQRESIDTVTGLVFRNGASVQVNKVALIEDLDKLPFPDIDLLPFGRYSLANALDPFVSIVTTRGCPWRCSFCLRDPVHVKLRLRSPSLVVDEIEERIKRNNAREINICNDSLTANRAHIEGICQELLRRRIKIRWQGPSRVDTVSPELLKLMAKAGCHFLRYGIESGSQDILDRMDKGITLEQIRRAFRWTREAGIEILAYFMLGYLDETPKTMRQTVRFAKELSPDAAIFSIATPLPNTKLFREAIARGKADSNYWVNFSLCRETARINYLIPDAESWVKRALWSFYFRPSYICRRLAKIRSWDALRKHYVGAVSFLRFRMYSLEAKIDLRMDHRLPGLDFFKIRILNQKFTLREIWKLRLPILWILLSYKKIFNFFLVYISRIFKRTKVLGAPITLMIEASSRCDMNCPMCPVVLNQTKRVKGDMELAVFKKIMDEVGERLFFVTLWNYGEPLLNETIFSMIQYAHAKSIMTVMSTNALSLNTQKISGLLSSRLDYLIVSFDGASETTYEKFRGQGNFIKVLENLKALIKERNKRGLKLPFITLQYIVMKENEHEVDKIMALARQLEVDKLSLKKFTYVGGPEVAGFLPTENKYLFGRYKGQKYIGGCTRISDSSVVLWDGTIIPCCGDLDFKYVFGNVKDNSGFMDIWNNEKYLYFRRNVFTGYNSVDICKRCPSENYNTDMFVDE